MAQSLLSPMQPTYAPKVLLLTVLLPYVVSKIPLAARLHRQTPGYLV